MTNNLHNLSTNQIADEYGAVDAQIKALETRKAELKTEMVKRDATFVRGERYEVTLSEQSSTRLDTAALKKALGEDICKEFEKTSLSTVARVKPVAPPVAIAA